MTHTPKAYLDLHHIAEDDRIRLIGVAAARAEVVAVLL